MKVEVRMIKDPFEIGTRRRVAAAMGQEWVRILRENAAMGKYGKGSKPYGTRTNNRGRYLGTVANYNEDYAARKGYPLQPVTLGDLPNRMRHGVRFDSNGMVIGIIFDSKRDQSLVKYHTEMGAGKGKIVRKFVYATQAIRKRMWQAGLAALRNLRG